MKIEIGGSKKKWESHNIVQTNVGQPIQIGMDVYQLLGWFLELIIMMNYWKPYKVIRKNKIDHHL